MLEYIIDIVGNFSNIPAGEICHSQLQARKDKRQLYFQMPPVCKINTWSTRDCDVFLNSAIQRSEPDEPGTTGHLSGKRNRLPSETHGTLGNGRVRRKIYFLGQGSFLTWGRQVQNVRLFRTTGPSSPPPPTQTPKTNPKNPYLVAPLTKRAKFSHIGRFRQPPFF